MHEALVPVCFHATPLGPAMGLDEDGKMRRGRRLMGRLVI